MTKKQITTLLFASLLISVIASALTFSGTVWYMKNHRQFNLDEMLTSFSFQTEEAPSDQPVFHSLDKLVLSVKGNRQTHFVMLELAIATYQPERIKNIDNYMPVVRNALLKLFSNKTYEELQNQPTIDALQEEVKQTLLTAFADTHIARDIDDVLLTKYVIQ